MSEPLVVCVDDDQAILDILHRCLRRAPITLRTTLDATQALSWIAQEPVAVLVSDYEMPAMTGAQLTGQAKRLRPETTRILLTGLRTFETVVDGINQGEIFRFIAKPFEPDDLRGAIDEAIARNRQLLAMSDPHRGERRDALRDALEAEYPGITRVDRDRHGGYHIPEHALGLAEDFGFGSIATTRPSRGRS